ncbi:MAG: ORF6N domain-containing protein [Candidatus Taylorbacteria bacterium]|nr:ORF6N domain-containing protein [Candidatus Taylorbacteria bacterium]
MNRAVLRNINRFPEDFMFQLALNEATALKSQFVTSKAGRGGRRKLPYVFTELGVAMLSSVLNSDRAVQMNIFIMRAFVKLREMLATHKDLALKIEELEIEQKKQGHKISDVSDVLKRMLADLTKPKDAIGFQTNP